MFKFAVRVEWTSSPLRAAKAWLLYEHTCEVVLLSEYYPFNLLSGPQTEKCTQANHVAVHNVNWFWGRKKKPYEKGVGCCIRRNRKKKITTLQFASLENHIWK